MARTALAVYRDAEKADAAARELERRALGHGDVVVADPDDARAAVLAEMHAEAAESWASPGLGVLMTKEMMRGALTIMVVLGAIGIPVGALLGLALFDETSTTWERLALGAGLGAVFFGTVGALLGGGLGVRPPDEPLAGEEGVPLRVDEPEDAALDVLKSFEPIRLDIIVDHERRTTPVTEGPDGLQEILDDVVQNARNPRRRN